MNSHICVLSYCCCARCGLWFPNHSKLSLNKKLPMGNTSLSASLLPQQLVPEQVSLCQGAHYRGKSGNFVGKKFPAGKNQGIWKKWEKSGNLEKTCRGNIREFSAIYMWRNRGFPTLGYMPFTLISDSVV